MRAADCKPFVQKGNALLDVYKRQLLHWCQLPRTLGQAVRRYGGGVYNHGLYFSSLAPARTTKPSGELLAEVEHSFGSVEGLHLSLIHI